MEVVLAAVVAAAVIFRTAAVHAWVVPLTAHATKNNQNILCFMCFLRAGFQKYAFRVGETYIQEKMCCSGCSAGVRARAATKTHSKVACAFCVSVVFV